MRNTIQTADDVQVEFARLRALKEGYEDNIKDSISELQESLKPINIIREVFDSAKEKITDGRSLMDTLKLGFKSITQDSSFKKGPSTIIKGIASLLFFNIIKGTQGDKKFDWRLFANGLVHDFTNNDSEKEDDD
ncbi:MAG: hypothetical protein KA954_09460 [Chitinophagales bacterium]|nr:hypothetical protein [Chitinophagales bacterium]MBP8754301.1 hypothetical protein [Chitinophagales bacterium]MBP9189077.1 hypothetical protein [Chitinophagales bacterium]MBP9548899.1 hypothetical protein [Chitinophagales bacterium]MBP9705170.1 hypothetical protein [Chitinophagales bacterium]